MEHVILVTADDKPIGTMEKMEAHKKGILHRAFSVLLFNSKGELLLQKRATGKYHSAGLWTNTCCSHPMPGEEIENAARRRLIEEMGVDAEPTFAYKFIYRVQLENNLLEHELDHVLLGTFDGEPQINPHEVAAWKYIDIPSLKADVQLHPERYTYWFKLILDHPLLTPVE
jgi:isopentenyl-diphosphate Delta-isomerase